MKNMKITRSEANSLMDTWITSNYKLPETDEIGMQLREKFHEFDKIVKSENIHDTDYFRDVHMGLYVYCFLWQESWFSMRKAADDDFWRYIAMEIMPDLVGDRWGYENSEHYWKRGSRIWPRQMWWYIHLSWQGDLDSTKEVLDSSNFNTDTILNLEERTGRNGTYINVYRDIIYYYAYLDPKKINSFNLNVRKYDKNGTLFRSIMKLHTVKCQVLEPELYLGGTREYVKELFRDAEIKV